MRSAVARFSSRAKGARRRFAPPPRQCPALHDDIVAFAASLRETDEEARNRERTVERLDTLLQRVHPGARAHVFGSSVTGLRLPFGDVDMMIEAEGISPKALLPALQKALRKTRPRTLLALPQARVPIIKWADSQTGVKVDACINNVGGLRNTAMLARAAAVTPALRPLVLVLKSQFLMHGLHQTHNGGLGGYLLANMVRHMLMTPPPPLPDGPPRGGADGGGGGGGGHGDIAEGMQEGMHEGMEEGTLSGWEWEGGGAAAERAGEAEDLGGLLLRFYWYYGHKLDLSSTICLEDGGTRLARDPSRPGFMAHAPEMLSISDPASPTSDIGAKSFRFPTARSLLRTSYSKLSRAIEQRPSPHGAAAAGAGSGGAARSGGRGRRPPSLLDLVLPRWGHHGETARKSQREWVQISRRRRQQEQRLKSAAAERQAVSRIADPVWAGEAGTLSRRRGRRGKRRRIGGAEEEEEVPVFL